MSPEARRRSIVDSAVELILATGHSSCTLEQVAQHAGISKALIYRYFSKREELLKAILEREFEALRGRGLDSIPTKVPVERVIRGTVERSLRYYHDHGPILRLLSSDPSVADLTRAGNRSARSSTTDYFVNRLHKHYGVPRDVALIAVTMTVNAPIHSMAHLRRRDTDIDRTIDVWTEFIIGGWQALQRRFGSGSAPDP
jgi:AcrR family transcriptional regulator